MATKKTTSDETYSPLTIRIPNRLRARLDDACSARQRSVSAVVEEILDRAVPPSFELERAFRELQVAVKDYCAPTGRYDEHLVLRQIMERLERLRHMVEQEMRNPTPPWKRNPDWNETENAIYPSARPYSPDDE